MVYDFNIKPCLWYNIIMYDNLRLTQCCYFQVQQQQIHIHSTWFPCSVTYASYCVAYNVHDATLTIYLCPLHKKIYNNRRLFMIAYSIYSLLSCRKYVNQHTYFLVMQKNKNTSTGCIAGRRSRGLRSQ